MRRGITPASITVCIFSFELSERYDRAQHASVRTSSSVDSTSLLRTGKAGLVCSKEGWGFPLQKFDKVQVAFLSMESFVWSWNWERRGNMAPRLKTRSRHFGESPATFPSAQTACSRTSSLGEVRRWIKLGIAPLWTITLVFSDVPEAMLVSAQAASN